MEPHDDDPEGGITKIKKAKILTAVILSVSVLIIVVQNSGAITLRVLFWDLAVHLVLLIPLVFLGGVVVGFIASRRRLKP